MFTASLCPCHFYVCYKSGQDHPTLLGCWWERRVVSYKIKINTLDGEEKQLRYEVFMQPRKKDLVFYPSSTPKWLLVFFFCQINVTGLVVYDCYQSWQLLVKPIFMLCNAHTRDIPQKRGRERERNKRKEEKRAEKWRRGCWAMFLLVFSLLPLKGAR